MTYELAKQLNDARFQSTHDDQQECFIKGCFFDELGATTEHSPTLSELIEACGEKFGHIAYWRGGNELGDWNAIAKGYQGNEWGNTPEIAVAKLWLALNKK